MSDGTVVEVHGMRATVLVHADQRRVRCRPLRDRTQLAVGDRVLIDEGGHGPQVMELGDRIHSLWRPVERGRRLMAAHVDRVVVVLAVAPQPSAGLLDRFLVAADAEDIDVLLVLNKSDLDGVDGARRVLAPYEALGYRVVHTSALAPGGVEQLREVVASGLSVFAGHSGVGKSSLLNALFPGIELRVHEVNPATGKGRHTTSVTTCHASGPPWPGGALVVDTPGVRGFGLYGVELVDIAHGFRDLRPHRVHCRFRDCLHEEEPDCAVRRAIEGGTVDPARYAGYRRILESVREGEG